MVKFPGWIVVAILAGLFLLGELTFLGFLLICAGVAGACFWYKENEKRRQGAILTIRMNSGNNLYFTFEEKEFLLKVISVLEGIIITGGVNSPVSINIKDCTITNSKVLTDINA